MDARKGVRRAALSALVLLVALPAALDACGSATTTGRPALPAANASASAGAAATATTMPAPRSNSTVALTIGQAHYSSSASIGVTIHNAGSTTVYAREQSTNCSMVSLQRLVNGTWQPVYPCLDGRPHTTLGYVAPGAAVPVELVPQSAGSVEGGGSGGASWPAGTYRAALSYTTSQSTAFGQGTLVYSSTFAVG
ncbi:MAG TPA: hypothetical protein VFU88_12510 [Ktedonobacterales bacterium]|nr:hypothetical protein [Ktedonobacterales bacterium]